MKRNLIVPLLAIFSCVSAFGQLPVFNHVFVVVEENHNYASVIANKSMPYLNSLASKYGLATQYYANTHPSIGNYFELTTGQTITNNDGYNKTVTADNVVRHLLTAGKTWRRTRKACLGWATSHLILANMRAGTVPFPISLT